MLIWRYYGEILSCLVVAQPHRSECSARPIAHAMLCVLRSLTAGGGQQLTAAILLRLNLTLCSCVSSCVRRRTGRWRPRARYVMHLAFVALHHRASNGVLRSSFEFLIGFRTLFEFWIGFGTLLDTQNLIWGPHSVPTYTPYTTELVVAGSKAYCNDQLWKTLVESHLVSFF